MLQPLNRKKKIGVIFHPYLPITVTSLQQPFSCVSKVAILERFNCIYKLTTF